jgi:hypothetical protein
MAPGANGCCGERHEVVIQIEKSLERWLLQGASPNRAAGEGRFGASVRVNGSTINPSNAGRAN